MKSSKLDKKTIVAKLIRPLHTQSKKYYNKKVNKDIDETRIVFGEQVERPPVFRQLPRGATATKQNKNSNLRFICSKVAKLIQNSFFYSTLFKSIFHITQV